MNGEGEEQRDPKGRGTQRPRPLVRRHWKDIALRVYRQTKHDNLSLVSAGVAFYGMLAIFPALAAIISIYGLVADPAQLQYQVQSLSQVMPESTLRLVSGQMQTLASSSGGALSIGLALGILLSVGSAMKGMTALMTALNIVYGESEKRGLFKYYAWAVLLTLSGVLFAVFAGVAVVVVPAMLHALGGFAIGSFLGAIISLLRWPILAIAMIFATAMLYRYGPSRDRPQWSWISGGAVVATGLWLLVSGGFSYYVSHFGNYNATYGSLGSVAVLLMWLYLSAYTVLLGAEINSAVEQQTQAGT